MSYVRQNKDNDGCAVESTSKAKAAAGLFSDQRESALVQLQQQQLMAAAPLQRMAVGDEEDELLQGKFVAQREGMEDEEDLLQGKFEPTQRAEKPNNTGLPDNLKSGIENLSGMSMDHVKVHYNSDKPAQLQAHAYAQGSEIHVAPGQEQHLPHEAWHVVQQMQGRVKPTVQMAGGLNVNDDAGLEGEADLMGRRAASESIHHVNKPVDERTPRLASASTEVLQPMWVRADNGEVSRVDTDDLSGLEVTTDVHQAGDYPQGSVHVKSELSPVNLPSIIEESTVTGTQGSLVTVAAHKTETAVSQLAEQIDIEIPVERARSSMTSREKYERFKNLSAVTSRFLAGVGGVIAAALATKLDVTGNGWGLFAALVVMFLSAFCPEIIRQVMLLCDKPERWMRRVAHLGANILPAAMAFIIGIAGTTFGTQMNADATVYICAILGGLTSIIYFIYGIFKANREQARGTGAR